MNDEPVIDGRARAWAFRWLSSCKPGKYIVTVSANTSSTGDRISFTANFDAVVDDFGNLVMVP